MTLPQRRPAAVRHFLCSTIHLYSLTQHPKSQLKCFRSTEETISGDIILHLESPGRGSKCNAVRQMRYDERENRIISCPGAQMGQAENIQKCLTMISAKTNLSDETQSTFCGH